MWDKQGCQTCKSLEYQVRYQHVQRIEQCGYAYPRGRQLYLRLHGYEHSSVIPGSRLDADGFTCFSGGLPSSAMVFSCWRQRRLWSQNEARSANATEYFICLDRGGVILISHDRVWQIPQLTSEIGQRCPKGGTSSLLDWFSVVQQAYSLRRKWRCERTQTLLCRQGGILDTAIYLSGKCRQLIQSHCPKRLWCQQHALQDRSSTSGRVLLHRSCHICRRWGGQSPIWGSRIRIVHNTYPEHRIVGGEHLQRHTTGGLPFLYSMAGGLRTWRSIIFSSFAITRPISMAKGEFW